MKKILGLIIALMLSAPVYASLGIAPTRLEINASKLKTNYVSTSIDVKGDSYVPMRFKIYTEYFKINEKSEVVPLTSSTDPYDLSKKVRFVPSEFMVLPGKTQKVRVSIPNAQLLPDGESRCILYIEDIQPKEVNLDTGKDGIGAQLVIKTRVGVPLYVDKGKFYKRGDIESLDVVKEADGLYTKMKIVSSGNSRIRYTAKGQIIQGKKLLKEYNISGHAVGDNNYYIAKDKINTENIVEKGECTLRITVSYFDEAGKRKIIQKETPINL